MKIIENALKLITNPQAHEHQDKPLVGYLLQMVGMRAPGSPWADKAGPGNGYKYLCMEHWVLQHGRYWDWSPLTDKHRDVYELSMGPMKRCYNNSLDASLENQEIVTYVEGYASGIITFSHAWNILTTESEDEIVDLTLRTDDRHGPPPTYFGVPFDVGYVEEVLDDCTVIDNWHQGWPLLKDDSLLERALHEDWKS